jgi:hypothetical protein
LAQPKTSSTRVRILGRVRDEDASDRKVLVGDPILPFGEAQNPVNLTLNPQLTAVEGWYVIDFPVDYRS